MLDDFVLNEKSFKNIISLVLILALFILAGIVIKPVIIYILFGILLAYMFFPLYQWLFKKTKKENLSASIVCIGLLIIIFASVILIIKYLISQAINFYVLLQNMDTTELLKQMIPALSKEGLSATLLESLNKTISNFLAASIDKFSEMLLNIPQIIIKLTALIFAFYFTLRDGKQGMEYIRSLLPLKKETQDKFLKHFKDVTNSVLMGQVVIGIMQGIVAGIGYFMFGVPNAIPLTFLTILVGIIPVVGPGLVWIPIDIYLFAKGNIGAGIGLLIYGTIIISWIDTIIRPLIVSRKTEINLAIVIIGMIGGLFAFGILGLIIGPLVLAYVLLVIELYRKKTIDESIIFKEEQK